MNTKTTLLALGTALLLTACGDSPQDVAASEPQPNMGDVPAHALGTATAYSQFAVSLVKTETGKPLDVNGVVAPTSETADPIAVF